MTQEGGGGVLPRILGQRCAAKVREPYLRTKKAKTDTICKAQSQKMTPYSRKKQNY